jgi:hypothetical protein
MKIRQCFVSNSSSSSFVVINDSVNKSLIEELKDTYYNYELVVDGKLGHTEFGWEENYYHDFGSKLIFAYLQCLGTNNKEWLRMLDDVLYETLKVKTVFWNITNEYNSKETEKTWGYIDHQSSACEGENTEIFESKQALTNFLFSEKSYIHTDNDNH